MNPREKPGFQWKYKGIDAKIWYNTERNRPVSILLQMEDVGEIELEPEEIAELLALCEKVGLKIPGWKRVNTAK